MALNIQIKNATKVRDTLNRIRDNLPRMGNQMAWNTAQIEAKHVRMMAQQAFSFPRGYLRSTIKPKKLGKGRYGVSSSRYAWFVEKGRGPGKAPPDSGIIRDWAKKAGIPPHALRASIGRKGTRGRPFIRPGIRSAHPDVVSMLKRKASRFVKSKGGSI